MVFKRYSGYGKVSKMRKRYKKRGTGYTTWGASKFLAKKALMGVNYLRKLINVEFKSKTGNSATQNPTTSGVVIGCVAPSPGTGADERTGNSIRLKSWNIRGTVVNNSAATTPTILRMIMFHDLQSVGSTPSVTDILDTADVNAMRKLSTTDRFDILMDKTYHLDNVSNPSMVLKLFKNMHRHWKFDGSSAIDNYPFILMISNQPTYAPTVNYIQRVRYIDN